MVESGDVTLLALLASSDAAWLAAAGGLVAVAMALVALRLWLLYLRSRDEQRNARALIENLSEGIYRSSLDGKQLSANRALVRLNGYDTEAEMLESVKDIAIEWYVDPGRRDEFRRILHAQGHVEDFVSEIYRHKTRERIWISESARIVRDKATGRPQFYEGSVREITETVNKLRLEELFQKLGEQVPGGLFQFTRLKGGEFAVSYMSSGFCRITGFPIDRGYPPPDILVTLIHREHRELFMSSMRRSGTELVAWECEFRATSLDGKEKWLRLTAAPEKVPEGVMWHGYIADISIRRRQELEIEKLAFYDPLTGLPNRRLFLERMADAVALCEGGKRRTGLLFIDLDHFKTLNDTQGHDVGDEFLREVAARLSQAVGRSDTVARLGGDEFVVMLEPSGGTAVDAADRARMAGEKIVLALRQPYVLGSINHSASASVGVVVIDGSERRTAELLKHADIAMYQAKASGRNAIAVFDKELANRESERFQMLEDLRQAIRDDALPLHFQAQIDRAGQVCGAEALLRWHHPVQGLIPAERCIPAAENSGLMLKLCRMVVTHGVRTLAEWQARPETASLRLAVNLSVRSFESAGFVSLIEDLVDTHAIDASKLVIEFTEQDVARDTKLVARRMRHLREIGIRFALDDFGSGYSSLKRLKMLPFDEVKIDSDFVKDIERSEGDRALVRTVLGMAAALGLKTVAEHVETHNQEAFLHAFGCDYFQGFLYSDALEADDFVAFVDARNRSETNVTRMSA